MDLFDAREQDLRASHFTGSIVLSTGGMRMRDQLRNRLSRARGVSIKDSKLKMRPTFSVDVLATVNDRQRVVAALEWFTEVLASMIASYNRHPERASHR